MRGSGKRTRLSAAVAVVALVVSIAGTPASASAALGTLALDDDIPGVAIEGVSELPSTTVIDSLDAVHDKWDIFSMFAFEGEQISFLVDPDPAGSGSTLNVAACLWGPWADSYTDPPVRYVNRVAAGEEEWLTYTVPRGASGTYYVGAMAGAGANETEYLWGVTSRADGNIPGTVLPADGFAQVVSDIRDGDDVYALHLGEGENLVVDVAVTDPLDDPVSVYLFGPGANDVWRDMPLDSDAAVMTGHVEYTAGPGQSGVYYVDVRATDGSTHYTLDWEATGPNVPGRALPPTNPFDTTLGTGISVGFVDLRSNETFVITLTDPGDDIDVWLLGPSTVNIASGVTVASDTGSATVKRIEYTVPAGEGGRYYVRIDTPAPIPTTIGWSMTTHPSRLAGATRYETAVAVSQCDFADGANTVVIASGEGFADALSAAGLAGSYDAPILLVQRAALPTAVRDEIVRLGATRCLIVGGPAAVGDGVATAIDSIAGMAAPVRIGGADRYETSALVADAVLTKDGWADWPMIAAMARGDLFADALALAPIAWAAKMPILLTAPDYLPLPIDNRLSDGPGRLPLYTIAFAGGTGAISDEVFNYVRDDLSIPADRFAGSTRYETAAMIADWSAGSPWLSYDLVGIATGEDFPDALGGGAAIGKAGGVLLLTQPEALTSFADDALTDAVGETSEVQVMGGVNAISDVVLNAIADHYVTY